MTDYQDPFLRLAPFIHKYIYQQNWTELRQVQLEACRVIFDTNCHLLLAAATASGKTEAAFLPILTLLEQEQSQSVSVLYISPIKALINDQFTRLNDLLQQSHIEVTAWHGDISATRKQKLLRNPQGILQITPESLESILINQASLINKLFCNLRFIVIDEIHCFMGTERGSQILCQLSRLSRYLEQTPRRIGLSATLGDYSQAETWLQSGTNLDVITPQVETKAQTVRLAVEYFELADYQDLGNHNQKNPPQSPLEMGVNDAYYQYLFKLSQGIKCLIFANSRAETETIISNLRQLAKQQNYPDIYHVHHGNISSLLREDAEAAMRSPQPAVIAATVTLELGIDLGKLERVIQLNAPLSVSSFLQRLGRTGRRDKPADMRFLCTEDALLNDALIPEQIPWQLLQTIAIIQLYLEERWIEPVTELKLPFSLLYQQTLSILAAKGELSPANLAQEVLTLPAFDNISQDNFRQLLRYWLSIDHLEQTPQGNLILGITGAKIARNFRFYAVFSSNIEYLVRGETGIIGTIQILPSPGQTFGLAGRTWQVIDYDESRKAIFAKPVEGLGISSWRGNGSDEIHGKVLEKMRQILLEDREYAYLQENAKQRLKQARLLAKQEYLDRYNLIPLEDDLYCWFPWVGTVGFRTLERWLNVCVRESLDIVSLRANAPYYLLLRLGKCSVDNLQAELMRFCDHNLTNEDLVVSTEAPKLHKYDHWIPHDLLRKAFAKDYLDLGEIRKVMARFRVRQP